MCRMASFVLTEKEVYWSRKSDSHEDIISEHNLKECGLAGKVGILRVEVSPENNDYSLPVDKWEFRCDQDILPDWYDAKTDEARTRAALQEWYSAKCFTSGRHEIRDARAVLYGSARAVLYDSASAVLYDSARAELYDSASAVLYDSARAELCDSASAKLYDSASAELYDSASAKLYGSASAVLYDSARAELYCSASAKLYDSARAKLSHNTTANVYGGNATGKDNAVVIDRTVEPPTVKIGKVK